MFICSHQRLRVCFCLFIFTSMLIFTSMFTYECLYAYVFVCISIGIYIYTYVCTDIYIYIQIYLPIYIYTYIYIYNVCQRQSGKGSGSQFVSAPPATFGGRHEVQRTMAPLNSEHWDILNCAPLSHAGLSLKVSASAEHEDG